MWIYVRTWGTSAAGPRQANRGRDGVSKRRILLALPDLRGGGAQQVVLRLLAGLPRERFEIHLVVARADGELRHAVPADVPTRDLRAASVRRAAPGLVQAVRALRPEVVFSTIHHLNHLLLALRPVLPAGTRLVVRETVPVSEALRSGAQPGRSAWLHRVLYPGADRIVVPCEAVGSDLVTGFGIPRAQVVRIFNPVDPALLRAAAAAAPDPLARAGPGPHLVAVGRLVAQKGFDRLISALPALLELRPSARLWILGSEAPPPARDAQQLRALCSQLGIADRVHFPGYRRDIAAWLARADLFVQASRYEGLPNALLDALALGCPVVALDAPGGTRELLERAGQLERLVANLDWRAEWFARPEKAADLSAFAPARVVADYEALFASA